MSETVGALPTLATFNFFGANMKTQKEILNSLISDRKSNWLEKAKYRKLHREPLDRCARVVLKMLSNARGSK